MVWEVPSNRALLFKSSDLELSGPRWDMSHKPLPEQSDAPGWEGALGGSSLGPRGSESSVPVLETPPPQLVSQWSWT